MSGDPRAAVQDALSGLLREDELVVNWITTIEVVGQDGLRYLAHRNGGGMDGVEGPTMWSAIGMSRAFMQEAERQLAASGQEPGA